MTEWQATGCLSAPQTSAARHANRTYKRALAMWLVGAWVLTDGVAFTSRVRHRANLSKRGPRPFRSLEHPCAAAATTIDSDDHYDRTLLGHAQDQR